MLQYVYTFVQWIIILGLFIGSLSRHVGSFWYRAMKKEINLEAITWTQLKVFVGSTVALFAAAMAIFPSVEPYFVLIPITEYQLIIFFAIAGAIGWAGTDIVNWLYKMVSIINDLRKAFPQLDELLDEAGIDPSKLDDLPTDPLEPQPTEPVTVTVSTPEGIEVTSQ